MTLFNVNFPPNIQIFFKSVKGLANFSLIPESMLDKIMALFAIQEG